MRPEFHLSHVLGRLGVNNPSIAELDKDALKERQSRAAKKMKKRETRDKKRTNTYITAKNDRRFERLSGTRKKRHNHVHSTELHPAPVVTRREALQTAGVVGGYLLLRWFEEKTGLENAAYHGHGAYSESLVKKEDTFAGHIVLGKATSDIIPEAYLNNAIKIATFINGANNKEALEIRPNESIQLLNAIHLTSDAAFTLNNFDSPDGVLGKGINIAGSLIFAAVQDAVDRNGIHLSAEGSTLDTHDPMYNGHPQTLLETSEEGIAHDLTITNNDSDKAYSLGFGYDEETKRLGVYIFETTPDEGEINLLHKSQLVENRAPASNAEVIKNRLENAHADYALMGKLAKENEELYGFTDPRGYCYYGVRQTIEHVMPELTNVFTDPKAAMANSRFAQHSDKFAQILIDSPDELYELPEGAIVVWQGSKKSNWDDTETGDAGHIGFIRYDQTHQGKESVLIGSDGTYYLSTYLDELSDASFKVWVAKKPHIQTTK